MFLGGYHLVPPPSIPITVSEFTASFMTQKCLTSSAKICLRTTEAFYLSRCSDNQELGNQDRNIKGEIFNSRPHEHEGFKIKTPLLEFI